MEAKYYVAVRPQTNDLHGVHKEGCPFLPDDGKRIYLGSFGSGQDAASEGRQYFSGTKSCPFCCKENNVQEEKTSNAKQVTINIVPVILPIPVSYHQGMFYCLN